MNFIVAKLFLAKIDGKQTTFHPGDTVNLPEGKAAKLILAGVLKPANIEAMEQEYFTHLKRFWEIDDDPDATDEEAGYLVERLDYLFQTLHRQGRRVPVRLPVEKRKAA